MKILLKKNKQMSCWGQFTKNRCSRKNQDVPYQNYLWTKPASFKTPQTGGHTQHFSKQSLAHLYCARTKKLYWAIKD